MSTAAVLVASGDRSSPRERRRALEATAAAAGSSGADELVAVVDAAALAGALPDGVSVLLDEAERASGTGALRVAADWCARQGHEVLLVGLLGAGDPVALRAPQAWRALADAADAPIVLAERNGRFAGLVRLDVMAWGLLPLEGNLEAALRAHAGLVATLDLDGSPATGMLGAQPRADVAEEPSARDRIAVERLLGRAPQGPFRVVVRDRAGEPVVIENAPFLDDGTPMPTRYWLVGVREREAVGRLEAAGGVRRAESAVAAEDLAAAHAAYAAERDAHISPEVTGPRPTGGVGGTRTGVKCLHAHLAWYLAGGPDPVGRFVAHELAGVLEGPVAAIDCGTNSTRLLILDRDGRRLVRETRITRLGEGVDETGVLASGAIERTLAVIGEYGRLIDRHGVVRTRCVATSAARDAANAEALFGPIAEVLGAPAELLSGDEEGRVAYAGATADLDPEAGPFLVVDLGGGSTELVTERDEAVELVSLAMGCVRVRERFLVDDPPSSPEIEAARAYARGLVIEARNAHPAFASARAMVGVAGTVSTLALLASGAPRYRFGAAHHLRLTRADVGRLATELGAMHSEARALVPGIEEGRADVIVAGALILDEVMDVLGYDELVCSESDILDGLAFSLLDAAPS